MTITGVITAILIGIVVGVLPRVPERRRSVRRTGALSRRSSGRGLRAAFPLCPPIGWWWSPAPGPPPTPQTATNPSAPCRDS